MPRIWTSPSPPPGRGERGRARGRTTISGIGRWPVHANGRFAACSNTYSALNALAGHYNNFGATTPVPKKRLERAQKVNPATHSLDAVKLSPACHRRCILLVDLSQCLPSGFVAQGVFWGWLKIRMLSRIGCLVLITPSICWEQQAPLLDLHCLLKLLLQCVASCQTCDLCALSWKRTVSPKCRSEACSLFAGTQLLQHMCKRCNNGMKH